MTIKIMYFALVRNLQIKITLGSDPGKNLGITPLPILF